MFALFERLLQPTVAPDAPEPPPGLVAFYWHLAKQAKPLFVALFVAGFVVAILDTMIPIFIGRLVTLVTSADPRTLFAEHGYLLIGMALVLLVLRPAALATQNLLANQAIAANVSNRIRWQNHWHVVRQS
jgi:ATP-binding cassette, subfamily B, multidrug efflux pump